MLFRKALGHIIAEHRKDKQLTLRQTAIRGSGRISLTYLWELENGRKEASSEMLIEVAQCLGISPSDLVIKVGMAMCGGVPNYLPKELDEQLVNL
jgi:transcriptional regulator with XRE-family HTH domain